MMFPESSLDKTSSEKGCWLWTRYLTYKGYGWILYKGKSQNAHRASYDFYKGSIPKGMWVLHTCDVRNCVNPEHLYLGNNKQNVQDRMSRGRQQDQHGVRNPNYKHGKYVKGGTTNYPS